MYPETITYFICSLLSSDVKSMTNLSSLFSSFLNSIFVPVMLIFIFCTKPQEHLKHFVRKPGVGNEQEILLYGCCIKYNIEVVVMG